jgi:hypothetical protein
MNSHPTQHIEKTQSHRTKVGIPHAETTLKNATVATFGQTSGMKPLQRLALFSACITLPYVCWSQACTPDTAYSSPGIYPDSATGIPPAMEGVPYSIVITAIVPPDTIVDLGGGPVYATIDSIVLVQIMNKPSWLVYDCEPPSCGFPGGTSSCALFHGTPPGGSAGKDTLDIIIRQHGKVSSFPVMLADTLVDFYVVEVLPGIGLQGIEKVDLGFGLVPVPTSAADRIEVISDRTQTVALTLFDALGRVAATWRHLALDGTSVTRLPSEGVNPGVYFFSMRGTSHVANTTIIVQ